MSYLAHLMKNALLFILLCCVMDASAQGDFLLLRKNEQVIQSYVKGSYFTCQLATKQWVEGRIRMIKDDSVFMEQMNVQQVANFWGCPP